MDSWRTGHLPHIDVIWPLTVVGTAIVNQRKREKYENKLHFVDRALALTFSTSQPWLLFRQNGEIYCFPMHNGMAKLITIDKNKYKPRILRFRKVGEILLTKDWKPGTIGCKS